MSSRTPTRWTREDRSAVASPKAYLTSIVTRLCIDQRRRWMRKMNYVGPWLPEPVVESGETEASGRLEAAESISMALLVVLESLSPVERAAYLLRRVFDYGYEEIGQILNQSEANCRQLVSRAEKRIRERRPRFEAEPAEARRLTAFPSGLLDRRPRGPGGPAGDRRRALQRRRRQGHRSPRPDPRRRTASRTSSSAP